MRSLDTSVVRRGRDRAWITPVLSARATKDAPTIDPDGELSQSEEAALYRHYRTQQSERAGHRWARRVGSYDG
jgi:hypothetical protein